MYDQNEDLTMIRFYHGVQNNPDESDVLKDCDKYHMKWSAVVFLKDINVHFYHKNASSHCIINAKSQQCQRLMNMPDY